VLSLQSGIEVFTQEIQRLLFSSIQDDLDSILKVNAHFVALQVVLSLLIESFFGLLALAFKAEHPPTLVLVHDGVELVLFHL